MILNREIAKGRKREKEKDGVGKLRVTKEKRKGRK